MFKRFVAIMGMPRSGTSWLSQIFDSSPEVRFRLSPLFSYEFKNRLDEQSGRAAWEAVLRGAYDSDNEFMDQTYRRRDGQYPVFAHKQPDPEVLVLKDTRFHNLIEPMLELFPEARMIALVRHPAGAINSWLRAPREFPADADPMAEWRSGACRKNGFGEFWGFDDWKWVTRLQLRLAQERPEQMIVQRYEDLVADPMGETRRLFEFCGLDFGDQTRAFLQDSQSRHDTNEYAVFKRPDVAERWHRDLDPRIQAAIVEDLTGTDLEAFIQ